MAAAAQVAISIVPVLSEPTDMGVFDTIETSEIQQSLVAAPSLMDSAQTFSNTRGNSDSPAEDNSGLLVVSPYISRSHLLNLSTVNRECQLLARALVAMRAIRSDYATAPYDAAFNWGEVIENVQRLLLAEQKEFAETKFYIVVFRSQVPRSTDRSKLGILDELAHEEAMESGGLLKYWFGTPDRNGRNLATCVWRHRNDARLGGAGPGHAKAMQETRALYTEWHVERLSLNISKGANSWSVTKWSD